MANGPALLKQKDKKKLPKIGKLQKECDGIMQEINRKNNPACEVCGQSCDTGHHFFPKSTSARLRYEFDNLIPICHGCHMQHHQAGNPRIHQTIIQRRGQEWYDRMNRLSREPIKVNREYYQVIKEKLLNS